MESDERRDIYEENQNWYDESDRPPVRPEPTPMGKRRRGGGFRRVLFALLVVALLGAATLGVARLIRESGWTAQRVRQTIAELLPGAKPETQETAAERSLPAVKEPLKAEVPPIGEPGQALLPISASAPGSETRISDDPETLSLQEIYDRLIASVVSIVTDSGSGTGIIMTADGYVITNHHVIKDARTVSVLTSDDRMLEAALIGSDKLSDLAVLKVEGSFTPAQFGDSSVLRVGDTVVAIGDPLGVKLRGTMTYGIISAINRDLTVDDRTMTLIQTDAALNNGNSGGPLINCYGQVIGVNTMKMSGIYSGSSASVEGLGFAIPIAVAKPIIDELIKNGYVAGRPAVGIISETMPDAFRVYYRLPAGIYIRAVTEGSDAAAKGLAPGDIVTAINGTPVTTTEELNTVKNQFSAGDTVTLTVYRDRQYYDVDVVLIDEASLNQP